MLISLELRPAHRSEVAGAVRIALQRAEVWRSIPQTSISTDAEEGRADSKHAEDLSQHLTCTWDMRMLMAPCTEIPMLKKTPMGVISQRAWIPSNIRPWVFRMPETSKGASMRYGPFRIRMHMCRVQRAPRCGQGAPRKLRQGCGSPLGPRAGVGQLRNSGKLF